MRASTGRAGGREYDGQAELLALGIRGIVHAGLLVPLAAGVPIAAHPHLAAAVLMAHSGR